MDLDYILPFAAIPENVQDIHSLNDKSELLHHVSEPPLDSRWCQSQKKQAATLSHALLKSSFLFLQITVPSATMVSIQSQKSLSKCYSIVGVPRAGVNISPLLALSSGELCFFIPYELTLTVVH